MTLCQPGQLESVILNLCVHARDAMTGHAENAALSKGFLQPGMELITKPFGMEQLASRVRGMLESG